MLLRVPVDPQEMVNPWGCAHPVLLSCSFLCVSWRPRLEPPLEMPDPQLFRGRDEPREIWGVADDPTSFRRRNHVSCRRWHWQQGWLGRCPLSIFLFPPLPPLISRTFFFWEQKTGEPCWPDGARDHKRLCPQHFPLLIARPNGARSLDHISGGLGIGRVGHCAGP